MLYLTLDENDIISEIKDFASPQEAYESRGKQLYTGAKIGDKYFPPEWKEKKIDKTKQLLSDFLSKNPILWEDGKKYSVTLEKQNLLNNTIAAYQIESTYNPDAMVTWNSVGSENKDWNIEDLCRLNIAIKNYVKPLVKYQQELEVEIKSCTTKEEIDAVVIDYYPVLYTSLGMTREEFNLANSGISMNSDGNNNNSNGNSNDNDNGD